MAQNPRSTGRDPNKVWAGGGRGHPRRPIPYPWPQPISYTMGGGTPPTALFFFSKKKVPKKIFWGQKKKSGLRPENKWDPKIPQKGRFLTLKNVKIFESNPPPFFLSEKKLSH